MRGGGFLLIAFANCFAIRRRITSWLFYLETRSLLLYCLKSPGGNAAFYLERSAMLRRFPLTDSTLAGGVEARGFSCAV